MTYASKNLLLVSPTYLAVLAPLPAHHRPRIHDAWRVLVIRPVRGVELNGARSNRPRLREDVRIIHGVPVVEGVALAPEPLDHAHVRRVEPAGRRRHVREPRLVVEADRFDNQRVALPVPDRVAQVGLIAVVLLAVRTP